MRKTVAMALAIVLCLGLCACTGVSEIKLPPLPTAEPTAAPTAATEPTAPAEASAVPEPIPAQTAAVPVDGPKGSVIVTNRTTEKDAYDPESGETLILRFFYDSPTVVIEDNPAAADKINEFVGKLTEAFYTGEDYGEGYGTGFNNMLTLAEDNYMFLAHESEMENPMYELSNAQSVSVVRNDGRVLVLAFDESSYTGGAHGSYSARRYCFDPTTGEQITLDTLSSDPAGLRAFLNAKLVEIARTDADVQERIDGFVQPDEMEKALGALLRDGSWYIDYDGLVVFSDLYEISSYAAGMISFQIPFSDLAGRINPRYLPDEQAATGAFKALSAGQMADGSTQIVDMIRIFDEGQTVYLVAEGEVRDVRLTSVAYSAFFHDVTQRWSCSAVTDAAVQLVTVIPDGMPNLKLSWRTPEGEQACYLTQSGEDGSLILMPVKDVEAVG